MYHPSSPSLTKYYKNRHFVRFLLLRSAQIVTAKNRMKMRQQHLVPLADQAVAILRDVRPLTGRGRYVFPSPRTAERPLSDNAVTAALRRMGYTGEQMSWHGFRAMASTLLNETGYPPTLSSCSSRTRSATRYGRPTTGLRGSRSGAR